MQAEVLKSPSPSSPTSSILGEILREDQVAADLNVHIKTLRRWHNEHIGPPRIKVGRQIFYKRAALLMWLERHQERRRQGR